jgi:hypothetical protein
MPSQRGDWLGVLSGRVWGRGPREKPIRHYEDKNLFVVISMQRLPGHSRSWADSSFSNRRIVRRWRSLLRFSDKKTVVFPHRTATLAR